MSVIELIYKKEFGDKICLNHTWTLNRNLGISINNFSFRKQTIVSLNNRP